eukprot:gb/GEZN01009663.1/.p1 GENE.gb/GEZN01009663.1/~~gb/GEZN01009663.1/.p1  ORF type:complete len:228 (+),score=20.90 gb/GEZN01009663.1/:283-966(+)
MDKNKLLEGTSLLLSPAMDCRSLVENNFELLEDATDGGVFIECGFPPTVDVRNVFRALAELRLADHAIQQPNVEFLGAPSTSVGNGPPFCRHLAIKLDTAVPHVSLPSVTWETGGLKLKTVESPQLGEKTTLPTLSPSPRVALDDTEPKEAGHSRGTNALPVLLDSCNSINAFDDGSVSEDTEVDGAEDDLTEEEIEWYLDPSSRNVLEISDRGRLRLALVVPRLYT